jgi:hypothetical protein
MAVGLRDVGGHGGAHLLSPRPPVDLVITVKYLQHEQAGYAAYGAI